MFLTNKSYSFGYKDGLSIVMHKNHEGPAVFDMLNGALELASREQRATEERNIRILIGQMHLVQGIIYSLQDKKEAEQFENYRSFVCEEFPKRGFLDGACCNTGPKLGQKRRHPKGHPVIKILPYVII